MRGVSRVCRNELGGNRLDRFLRAAEIASQPLHLGVALVNFGEMSGVQLRLRGDHVGQHLQVVGEDGGRGLVAGGFQGEEIGSRHDWCECLPASRRRCA